MAKYRCVACEEGENASWFVLENYESGKATVKSNNDLMEILSGTTDIVCNIRINNKGNPEVIRNNVTIYNKPNNHLTKSSCCCFLLNNIIYGYKNHKFDKIARIDNIDNIDNIIKRIYIYNGTGYGGCKGAIIICNHLLKLNRYGNNTNAVNTIKKRKKNAEEYKAKHSKHIETTADKTDAVESEVLKENTSITDAIEDKEKDTEEQHTNTKEQDTSTEEQQSDGKVIITVDKIKQLSWDDAKAIYKNIDYTKFTDEELEELNNDKEGVYVGIRVYARSEYTNRHDNSEIIGYFTGEYAENTREKILAELDEKLKEIDRKEAEEERKKEEQRKAAIEEKKKEEAELADTKTDDKEKFMIAVAYTTNFNMSADRVYLLDLMSGNRDILPADVVKNDILKGRLSIGNLKPDNIVQELEGYKDLMRISERKRYKLVYKRGRKYYVADNEGNVVIKSNEELQFMLKTKNTLFEYSTYLDLMLHEDELEKDAEIQPDPDCEICHGTGIRYLKEFGRLKFECSCLSRQQVERSTLKQVRAAIKYHISKIETNEAILEGLIPEYRWDDEWNKDILETNVIELGKLQGYKLSGYREWTDTLMNILMTISSSLKVKESYLIEAPNSFGKTTFAYTCIKRLYSLDKKAVPYITLSELGVLRKEYDRFLADRSEPKKEFMSKRTYTWDSYIKANIVFVCFTSPSLGRLEWDVLSSLLRERSLNALPTIAFMDSSLEEYTKDEALKREYIDNFLSYNSHKSSYERMSYVAVKRKYKK